MWKQLNNAAKLNILRKKINMKPQATPGNSTRNRHAWIKVINLDQVQFTTANGLEAFVMELEHKTGLTVPNMKVIFLYFSMVGEWKLGYAHGKGKFYHTEGDLYDGEWKYNQADGFGIYKNMNGARYEGEWKQDSQHGRGVEVWNDNSRYEGNYFHG